MTTCRKNLCILGKQGARNSASAPSEEIGEDIYQHVCGVCDEGFPSMEELFKHMDKHDSTEGQTCTVCNKEFRTVQGKNFHLHVYNYPYLGVNSWTFVCMVHRSRSHVVFAFPIISFDVELHIWSVVAESNDTPAN